MMSTCLVSLFPLFPQASPFPAFLHENLFTDLLQQSFPSDCVSGEEQPLLRIPVALG